MLKKISKSLIISYIVTFILLLIFAMIMYYGNVSEKVVGIFVIITYFISSLLGGLSIGKGVEKRRFLWGMILGVLYFGIIMMITLVGRASNEQMDSSKITGFITSCIGGMLGGMIS